jgi:EAL domain-containing protein (putative c-di-GMP-specific phosphodiesterase class I)/GGDEF domain-containing protein
VSVIKTISCHILIAVSVALAQWISSFYRFPQYAVPLIVLGSGIILGLLYRMGAKVLPALFVGLVCSFWLLIGYKPLTSFWVATTMLISSWMALIYLREFTSTDLIDKPVHNFLHFYVAAILISPISNAIMDLPLIWILDITEQIDDIRLFVFSYSFGEALGSLVFAPAIMLFGRNYHLKYAYADYSNLRDEKLVWIAIAATLIIATFFIGKNYFFAGLLDAELLLYPMMIWSALRLGVVFTNYAVAIIAYTVFTFHFFGIAGTAREMTIPEVLGMLLLIITLSILGQLVSAATVERRKKEAALEQAASQDPVTGLPNIRRLQTTLESYANDSNKTTDSLMLGYISICNHKALVQGYGIQAQYALYQQFGNFIKFHAGTEIYRVSGPDFVLLLAEKEQQPALELMRELAVQVRQFQFIWQQKPFHINAVYSLVPINLDPAEIQASLEHASALAESAFNQGNIGTVVVNHHDNNKDDRVNRANWLGRINEALAKDLFTLVAQPIVPIHPKNTEKQEPLYFELLLRMQNHDNELIFPLEFMPHAESFNLMPNIDRWVVRHALQWLSSEKVDLQKIAMCSINLSGQSITDPTFRDDIAGLIAQHHVPAEKICFEITETSAIANLDSAASFVIKLRNLGCSVALDDFGSGLSSFEYLKKLPVNILKIEGTFVHNMPTSATDCAIVEAVWRVAQTMNLKTVAEYVESEEILGFLVDMGVTYAQGFHTGRPVALDKLLQSDQQHKSL